MFIIFGTRGLKHTVSESPVLSNSCPNCNNGNLVNKLYRRWFTLFFIPMIPLDVVDRFYQCDSCKSAYNENIKTILQRSQDEINENQKRAKLVFAKALIASMTHMSIIDGDFAAEEEREIMDAIEGFLEMKEELMAIHQNIKATGNQDNQVFNFLNEARNELSSEALINILAQAAVVLLADGAIEKEEENLMKEYLIACGLPKEMYQTLIDKLMQKDMTKIKKEQLN
ncbi:tellurite resistance protein [Aquimarina sp. EL_43]|uniref:TerB family tellurite resistance protein n=1 Tax=unclassified Aquimarina TaxID=2627091 RepID=UPI0018CA464B|nr:MULTISPECIES: TerB family tellurite resistance protein [unclassified Aquimarina]MBG6133383.1 tellurite resistance protein [Aquimarina sp. EL_35]MBG6153541.1 tellurite resistance protein [Aquimarina sp. EL_32]MBG6171697.1 tellurite resistance protein [Aquimarina sp. EL_43]